MMRMLKKILALLCALALVWSVGSVCLAEIIPPYGEGQNGYQVVVLCDSLAVRQEPDANAAVRKTLRYGDRFIVVSRQDGWAACLLSDAVDADLAGWVNADYLAIDPAWYRTEKETPVYAWNELSSPKVALLEADNTLPILKQDGDWILVSLRGAAGWICLADGQ